MCVYHKYKAVPFSHDFSSLVVSKMSYFFRPLIRHARFYSTKTLVQLENAQVHRFGVKEPAFKDLSLTLDDSQRLVIVGPVSAGKTTLAEV